MLEKERQRVNKNMRIGLIHTAFIGDIVLCGLLIEALHRAGHQITFFTKPKTSSIYQHDPRVASVISLKKSTGIKKIAAINKMSKQIKAQSLDILICPHKSFTTALCAYLSGVKIRIGFKRPLFSKFYTKTVPLNPFKHECLRYLDLLTPDICPMNIQNDLRDLGRPILHYPQEFMRREVQNLINDQSYPYAVIAMGSVWATKKYPQTHFIQLCQKILTEFPNLKIYLTGDKTDRIAGDDLIAQLPQFQKRIHLTAGEISLTQFASLVANAKFVVSNDSAPTHFAAGFNIPTICFFGPTSVDYGFGPTSEKNLLISHKTIFGENLYCQPCSPHGTKKCPEKHHKCMKNLTPDRIFPNIQKFVSTLL